MNVLRGLLLDNLGLKLVALLLAVLVYLNVFTDRPASMMVAFPIEFTDLPDTLTLAGDAPGTVEAELRGTGKQFIRLWLTEPRVKLSLFGMGPGRHHLMLREDDLPLIPSDRLTVERLVTSDTVSLDIEHRISRRIPVAPRVEGVPKRDRVWTGVVLAYPPTLMVRGPRSVVGALDSLRLEAVRIDGRRDSVRAVVKPAGIPAWCSVEPQATTLVIPLAHVPH
jgi:hypothetical protein